MTSQRTCPACGRDYSPDCPICRAPNAERVPQPRGIFHPHRLRWGDSTAAYLECERCGIGFARSARLLDLLTECPGAVTP